MQRQSYQVKTVLEKKGARKKTFLAFKDSLGNPLSRTPFGKPRRRRRRATSLPSPLSKLSLLPSQLWQQATFKIDRHGSDPEGK